RPRWPRRGSPTPPREREPTRGGGGAGCEQDQGGFHEPASGFPCFDAKRPSFQWRKTAGRATVNSTIPQDEKLLRTSGRLNARSGHILSGQSLSGSISRGMVP